MIITSKDLDNNVFTTIDKFKHTDIDFKYSKDYITTTVTYGFMSKPTPEGDKWNLVAVRIFKESVEGETNQTTVFFNYDDGKIDVDSRMDGRTSYSNVEFSLNEYAILAESDRIRRQLKESNYISLQLLRPEHMSFYKDSMDIEAILKKADDERALKGITKESIIDNLD